VIVYANESPRARAVEAALVQAAPPEGLAPDVCVVLGGDGTMLRAIARHGGAFRYVGVNCGHLGFLMNDLPGEPGTVARTVARLLVADRWLAPRFPRLRMRAADRAGALFDARALNDVYVERMRGQTCHLRVTVDGVEVVRHMVCDGIVIATSLGSTAYSFSAGGPAAHPLLRQLHVTAICPHHPRLHPLLLPIGTTVRVEVLDAEERPARAVSDGVAHEEIVMVEIVGGSDEVTLCFAEGHNFTSTMIRKVLQGA
jgi:NAD+ kinase